jgi:hypothetical protein
MALTSDAAGEGAPHADEGGRSVLAEFLDAMRGAAYGILDEQKGRAAQEVADIAEAVRCSARSLDKSDNPAIARYVERAALGIDHLAEAMRQRSWHDILADTEEFAQRRPAFFVLGAIAAGFAAGCLASLPAPGAARGEAAPRQAEAERPASLSAAPAEPAHRSARRRAKDGA